IALLNIKGQRHENKNSKYKTLCPIIRKSKAAIVALTETKLKLDDEDEINAANPKIHIVSNPGLDSENAQAGIAFALNKDIIRDKQWTHEILIQGRMSKFCINWTEEHETTIILVYVPNDLTEKIAFLTKANSILEQQNLESSIIMGDWNSVECSIDRSPPHRDDRRVERLLQQIRFTTNTMDGWRMMYPTAQHFTYHHNSGSLARIDRIYCTKDIFLSSYNWNTTVTQTLSDHDMIEMEILKKNLPYIGPGAERVYTSQLNDPTIQKQIR
ncbi:Endonuclease/exonuclease/phosphatase, partial [Epithele typhae]|uniref:Endonuclease/exonuclease/phosphatase n=1 Tax=Epithele typhae TaxID=378194 RepID=UPI002007E3D8